VDDGGSGAATDLGARPADGSSVRRLLVDRSEREAAWLRLVAAAVTGAAALWLATLRPPPLVWAFVAGGAIAALAWVARGLAGRRRAASPERHALELGPDALSWTEGTHERRIVWGEIVVIDVDEDRLIVRVHRRGGSPLELEPRYGGLGVYDLARELESARRRALESAASRR
jgi:hypothetical protein